MASDDFYTHSARARLQQINADRAQALAGLEQAKASADYVSAQELVQAIANIDAESRNLLALHQRYVDSQTPPEQPELTQEERHAKPWDKMDYSDTWELSQTSKYGVDENAFRRGMLEVQRRRARGE